MIYIDSMEWESFYSFLVTEVKISQKKRNTDAIRVRFNTLCRYFADKPFTREAFNEFISKKMQGGSANSSLNKFIVVAKQIDRWKKTNLFDNYTYYKEERQYYDILSTDEVKKLAEVKIEYFRYRDYINQRNRALIYYLYGTGSRIDEALSAKWTDLHQTPWGLVVHYPMTKNGTARDVLLQPFVADLIQGLPKMSDLVFDTKHAQEFNLDLKRRAKATGIDKRVWCHLFRHSFASHMLIDKEVDGHIVAIIGGWNDPKSLQRYNQMDIKSQAKFMMMHDLGSETQKLDDIKTVAHSFIDKILNKKLWTAIFDKTSDDELHIVVKRVRLLPYINST